MINGDRLWKRLEELGDIGRNESSGGITRLSFTDEERAAKDLVTLYMQEANLSVREDAVGNLIGRKEGSDPEAPVILVGSHIDSVYEGGMFDGALGVLAGVEVLQAMYEQGVTTSHPIEVIAFTDEEGARFGFGMIGSRAAAGTLEDSDLERTDEAGVSIAEAMERSGLDPGSVGEAARPKSSVEAYVEVHIEQGKVLESQGLPVSVVEGIASILWREFTVSGESGHAGTNPMNIRRDALSAATRILQVIEEEAKKTGTTVGTVGQLEVSPGGINIIPGEVKFTLDLRDRSEQVRDSAEQRILDRAQDICTECGAKLQSEVLQRVEAAPCSQDIQHFAQEACRELDLDPITLPSGAGHDAMQLKDLCQIGMIFVRSKNGISHNPEEWSTKEDCAYGTEVLHHTVLKLASRA
jgi:allantoate deiminase